MVPPRGILRSISTLLGYFAFFIFLYNAGSTHKRINNPKTVFEKQFQFPLPFLIL